MAIYKNTPPIVPNGLIMHLDAGSRMSYASGSTTWNDLSGNGNNGLLTVSGSGATSASFDSTNQGSISFTGNRSYITIPNSISSSISTTSTVSCWIYRSTIFNTDSIGAQNIFSLYQDDNNRGAVYFSTDLNYVGRIASLLVEDGSNTGRVYTQQSNWDIGWYNIVTTRAASNYKIYINGVEAPLTIVSNIATKAFPTNPISSSIAAGYFSTFTYYNFYTGNIANVQIYNRALSAQEIAQNYNALKSRFGLT